MSMMPPGGAPGGQPGGAPPGAGPQLGGPPPQALAQMAQAFQSPPGPSFSPSYTDLSTKMDSGWQLLDVANRNIKSALNSGTFYRTPAVLAAVRQIEADLAKLIASYARGAAGKPADIEAPMIASEGAADSDSGEEDGADAPDDSGSEGA